jgi:hypothetical protein
MPGRLSHQYQGTINIVNFWNNAPEVARLRGELSDLMLATGIGEIMSRTATSFCARLAASCERPRA